MSDLASIENLINPNASKDEGSVQGKFVSKQAEIKLKEIEKQTERKASSLSLSYINLSSFPISPEAIGLIPEDTAIELGMVCFFYDGKNIRIACLNPTKEIAAS